MNLAKQLEENEVETHTNLQSDYAAEPSNIINLPEQVLSRRSLEMHTTTDVFVDHEFSALNEW